MKDLFIKSIIKGVGQTIGSLSIIIGIGVIYDFLLTLNTRSDKDDKDDKDDKKHEEDDYHEIVDNELNM